MRALRCDDGAAAAPQLMLQLLPPDGEPLADVNWAGSEPDVASEMRLPLTLAAEARREAVAAAERERRWAQWRREWHERFGKWWLSAPPAAVEDTRAPPATVE